MTKEEILIGNGSYCIGNRIESHYTNIENSMEEYAKQEALEFNFFYLNKKVKYLGWSYDNIWNEYQKSKVK